MNSIVTFCVFVIISGWLLGYLLSRSMKGTTSPTPIAMLLSLLAVSIPTIMAFSLSDALERGQLLRQFNPALNPIWYLFAIGIPIFVAVIGHIAGILTARGEVKKLPSWNQIAKGVSMLPMVIIWGGLEEIGWRGFLATKLSVLMSPFLGCLFVGLLWGVWHAPQMFTNPKLKEAFGQQLWLGAILWIGQCIGLGGLLGWLQLRSGSFLIPMIAHGLVNILGTISDETLGTNKNPKWSGFSGFPTVVVALLLSTLLFCVF